MSSNAAGSSKPQNTLKLDESTSAQQPAQSQLSGLEEDDEFEEFAVQGTSQVRFQPLDAKRPIDWDDAQTELAHLGGAQPGAAKSGGDKLWEDNWDDDDIEDDFSVQLRCVTVLLPISVPDKDQTYTRNELAKTGQGTTGVGAAATVGDRMQQ
jgi:26 proteasome complex subunit DSS1